MAAIHDYRVLNDYLPYKKHIPLGLVRYKEKKYRLYEVEEPSGVFASLQKAICCHATSPAEPKKIKAIFIKPSYDKEDILNHVALYRLEKGEKLINCDRDIALKRVKTIVGYDWRKINPYFKRDKNFIKDALQMYGSAFQNAHIDLRKDKELVLAALASKERVYPYLHDDLKKDKEIALLAIRNQETVLLYAAENLKKDKEVVRAAVLENTFEFDHAHEDLRRDKEFILELTIQDECVICRASKDLYNDRAFRLKLVEINFKSFTLLPKEWQMDYLFIDARNRALLNHLRFLREDPAKKQELLELTTHITTQPQTLFLHEEHPLFQEALEAHFIVIADHGKKNPYQIYNNLSATLKQEALFDDFAYFRQRAATLKSFTFADIPKGIILPGALFATMQDKGVDEAQVAALCNGATFEEIKGNIIGEGKLIPSLLAQKGKNEESLPLVTMYLYLILERIAKEDDTRKRGKLSDRECMLLKFASMVRACLTGQADAIELYYIYTINQAAQASGQAKIEETVDLAMQIALKKVLANDAFLKEVTGDVDVKQQSHQTLYLQNRYHKQIGLRHTLKFDQYTGVLYDRLIEKAPQEVIAAIKKHLQCEKEVKSALDRAIQDPKGITYMEFTKYLEEQLGLKDPQQCFEFDEDFKPIGLTLLAVSYILKQLKYVL
jgi:hypothetical protein